MSSQHAAPPSPQLDAMLDPHEDEAITGRPSRRTLRARLSDTMQRVRGRSPSPAPVQTEPAEKTHGMRDILRRSIRRARSTSPRPPRSDVVYSYTAPPLENPDLPDWQLYDGSFVNLLPEESDADAAKAVASQGDTLVPPQRGDTLVPPHADAVAPLTPMSPHGMPMAPQNLPLGENGMPLHLNERLRSPQPPSVPIVAPQAHRPMSLAKPALVESPLEMRTTMSPEALAPGEMASQTSKRDHVSVSADGNAALLGDTAHQQRAPKSQAPSFSIRHATAAMMTREPSAAEVSIVTAYAGELSIPNESADNTVIDHESGPNMLERTNKYEPTIPHAGKPWRTFDSESEDNSRSVYDDQPAESLASPQLTQSDAGDELEQKQKRILAAMEKAPEGAGLTDLMNRVVNPDCQNWLKGLWSRSAPSEPGSRPASMGSQNEGVIFRGADASPSLYSNETVSETSGRRVSDSKALERHGSHASGHSSKTASTQPTDDERDAFERKRRSLMEARQILERERRDGSGDYHDMTGRPRSQAAPMSRGRSVKSRSSAATPRPSSAMSALPPPQQLSEAWNGHPDAQWPSDAWQGHPDAQWPSDAWQGHPDAQWPSDAWHGHPDAQWPSDAWQGHPDAQWQLNAAWQGYPDAQWQASAWQGYAEGQWQGYSDGQWQHYPDQWQTWSGADAHAPAPADTAASAMPSAMRRRKAPPSVAQLEHESLQAFSAAPAAAPPRPPSAQVPLRPAAARPKSVPVMPAPPMDDDEDLKSIIDEEGRKLKPDGFGGFKVLHKPEVETEDARATPKAPHVESMTPAFHPERGRAPSAQTMHRPLEPQVPTDSAARTTAASPTLGSHAPLSPQSKRLSAPPVQATPQRASNAFSIEPELYTTPQSLQQTMGRMTWTPEMAEAAAKYIQTMTSSASQRNYQEDERPPAAAIPGAPDPLPPVAPAKTAADSPRPSLPMPPAAAAAAAAGLAPPPLPASRSVVTELGKQGIELQLEAGQGIDLDELPLQDALRELMTRFYLYERHSVPVLRELDTRVVALEQWSLLEASTGVPQPAWNKDAVARVTSEVRREMRMLMRGIKTLHECRAHLLELVNRTGTSHKRKRPMSREGPEKRVASDATQRTASSSSSHMANKPGPAGRVSSGATQRTVSSSSSHTANGPGPVGHVSCDATRTSSASSHTSVQTVQALRTEETAAPADAPAAATTEETVAPVRPTSPWVSAGVGPRPLPPSPRKRAPSVDESKEGAKRVAAEVAEVVARGAAAEPGAAESAPAAAAEPPATSALLASLQRADERTRSPMLPEAPANDSATETEARAKAAEAEARAAKAEAEAAKAEAEAMKAKAEAEAAALWASVQQAAPAPAPVDEKPRGSPPPKKATILPPTLVGARTSANHAGIAGTGLTPSPSARAPLADIESAAQPKLPTETPTTSTFASGGLRARAQQYLQNYQAETAKAEQPREAENAAPRRNNSTYQPSALSESLRRRMARFESAK